MALAQVDFPNPIFIEVRLKSVSHNYHELATGSSLQLWDGSVIMTERRLTTSTSKENAEGFSQWAQMIQLEPQRGATNANRLDVNRLDSQKEPLRNVLGSFVFRSGRTVTETLSI